MSYERKELAAFLERAASEHDDDGMPVFAGKLRRAAALLAEPVEPTAKDALETLREYGYDSQADTLADCLFRAYGDARWLATPPTDTTTEAKP